MAKTYLDQIVEYPAKVMLRLAEDKYCTFHGYRVATD